MGVFGTMIVWVASYPRSGNTFLRIVLSHMYGVSTRELYRKKLPTDNPNVSKEIAEWVGFEEWESLDELRMAPEPAFLKTHELSSDDSPALYVVRDGRDTMVSYAHFILTYEKKVPAEEYAQAYRKVIRQVIADEGYFGGWSKHVESWTKRKGPTAVIKYSDLIKSPQETTRSAIAQLGLSLEENKEVVIPTFGELKQAVPAFFRSGKVGSHEQEMNEADRSLFWKHHGATMTAHGFGSN